VSQDHQEQYTKKHILFQILPIQNIIWMDRLWNYI